jgi:hypothetical protein
MVADWTEKHSFFPSTSMRKIFLDPKRLDEPGTGWKARRTCPKHVKVLEESFKTSSTINRKVSVVIMDDALFATWAKAKELAEQAHAKAIKEGYEQTTKNIDQEFISWDDVVASKVKFYTFSGNHTRQAVCNLQKADSDEERWARIELFEVLICPVNVESRRFLRSKGNMSNVENDSYLVQGFPELVQEMRVHIEQLKKDHQATEDKLDNALKKAIAVFKKDMASSLQKSEGTVGQYYMCAILPTPIWTKFIQVITGDYKSKQKGKENVPCKSASHFTSFVSLPKHLQLSMLTSVLDGTSELTQFGATCKGYKAEIRGNAEMFEFLDARGMVGETKNPLEFLNLYPGIGDNCVKPWIGNIKNLKLTDNIDVKFFDQALLYVETEIAIKVKQTQIVNFFININRCDLILEHA